MAERVAARVLCADASDILTAILDVSPVPRDSPSSRAVWLRDTAAAVRSVLKAIDLEYRIAVESFVDAGCGDNRYEVVPLSKIEREVDRAALRAARPDLYEQLAFIDADTAMEILGQKAVRSLVLDKTDSETVFRLDSVNIQPFEKLCRVLGEDASRYITEVRVPNGYVLREVSAADGDGSCDSMADSGRGFGGV